MSSTLSNGWKHVEGGVRLVIILCSILPSRPSNELLVKTITYDYRILCEKGSLMGPLVPLLCRFRVFVSFWLLAMLGLAFSAIDGTVLFLATVLERLLPSAVELFAAAILFLSCAVMLKLWRLRLRFGADFALSCSSSSLMVDLAFAALRFFLASHSSCLSTTDRFLLPSNLATTDSGLSNGLPDLLFHSSFFDDSAVRLVSRMNDDGASLGPFDVCFLYMNCSFWETEYGRLQYSASSMPWYLWGVSRGGC